MTRENVCQGTFSRITRRSRGQRHSEVGRGSTSLHARRPARVGGLEKVAGAYLQGAPAPVRSRETGSSWVLWGVLCRGGRGGGGGCGGDGVRRRWARCRRRCSGGVGRPAPVRAGRRRESRCVRAGRGPGSRPLRPRAAHTHPRAGPGRGWAPRRQPDRTPPAHRGASRARARPLNPPTDSDPPPHPGQSTQPLPGPTGHVGRHGNVIGTSGHQHTSHRNGDTAHEPGNSPTNRNEVTPLTASTRSDAAAAQLTGSWRAAPPGTGGTGRRG